MARDSPRVACGRLDDGHGSRLPILDAGRAGASREGPSPACAPTGAPRRVSQATSGSATCLRVAVRSHAHRPLNRRWGASGQEPRQNASPPAVAVSASPLTVVTWLRGAGVLAPKLPVISMLPRASTGVPEPVSVSPDPNVRDEDTGCVRRLALRECPARYPARRLFNGELSLSPSKRWGCRSAISRCSAVRERKVLQTLPEPVPKGRLLDRSYTGSAACVRSSYSRAGCCRSAVTGIGALLRSSRDL